MAQTYTSGSLISPAKIIFMGDEEFSLPSLQFLYDYGFNLELVVTNPPKPKGRGKITSPSVVHKLAEKLGLKVMTPPKLKDETICQELLSYQPELIVVVAYGHKIPSILINKPKFAAINLHPSLLPKYRGAAPMQWAIANGETETGITTMYINEAWDAGDIIYQEKASIYPEENYGTLSQRLAQKGAKLLGKTVRDILAGKAPRYPQDPKQATFAPLIKKEQEKINWQQKAQDVVNWVRAITPSPGAYTLLNNKRIKIFAAEVIENHSSSEEPGKIIGVDKGLGPLVACKTGIVRLLQVQPMGRKVMKGWDAVNGRIIKINDIFQ